MEKDSYTVREVSQMLDIPEVTLRHFEKEIGFKVPRDGRNHRFYTSHEIELIKQIREWRDKGLSLQAIRTYLGEQGVIEEQRQGALEVSDATNLTMAEIQESFRSMVVELVLEREREITRRYEEKLEQAVLGIREEIQTENQKLMQYIQRTREDKEKPFWKKLFKRP